jgi:hypothetical protein
MNKNDSLDISGFETKQIETIAAHIDGDVTKEEMEEIQTFIKFIKSQRK